MKYLLCHKNINVLSFEMLNDEIYDIHEIFNNEHLPLFLKSKKDTNKLIALKKWWNGRCIPSSRQNLDDFLSKIEGNSLKSIIIKSMGLSLSDHYWIKPNNSNIKWEDVNFYENDFSTDVGDLLFGIELKKKIDFISPDNSSDGWLLKKWIIKKNERFLIKGGSSPYEQEPFNEVLAAKICECLNIPHAEYTLTKIDNSFFCCCNNIASNDLEIISAWNIFNTYKKEKNIKTFENFINCCKELNIDKEDKLQNDIAKMILLDFIMANTDRHYNNFSFVRKSDTLEWQGLAPVFDTGTSMFNRISTEELKIPYFTDSNNIKAKPFYTKQQKQLESFSTILALQNINFDSLKNVPDYYSKLLSQNKKISEERRNLLTAQLQRRINHSKAIIYRKNNVTKQFLKIIYEDSSPISFLDKITNTLTELSSQNENYKQVINNYLKVLNPEDESEMEALIKKDINYFFNNKKKIKHITQKEPLCPQMKS